MEVILNKLSILRISGNSKQFKMFSETPKLLNENILPNMCEISAKLSARNNTQERQTKTKVTAQPINLGVLSDIFLNAFVNTTKIPCTAPHKTKVQLAPCHNPLTKNTIITFK